MRVVFWSTGFKCEFDATKFLCIPRVGEFVILSPDGNTKKYEVQSIEHLPDKGTWIQVA